MKSIKDESPLETALREREVFEKLYKEYYEKFNQFANVILPKLASPRDGLKFKSASWNTTTEGKLFPYIVYEGERMKGKRTPFLAGYLCPACYEFNCSELTAEKVEASGRDYAMWRQDWHCTCCKAEWQYIKVWND